MGRRVAELKQRAAEERRRGHHQREAELYDAIAQLDGDPIWKHRAGEAWRDAGALREARRRFTVAAQGFAEAQQHGKAVVACRMALDLAPNEPLTRFILERSERALGGDHDGDDEIEIEIDDDEIVESSEGDARGAGAT